MSGIPRLGVALSGKCSHVIIHGGHSVLDFSGVIITNKKFKGSPGILSMEVQNAAAAMENSVDVPQKK